MNIKSSNVTFVKLSMHGFSIREIISNTERRAFSLRQLL